MLGGERFFFEAGRVNVIVRKPTTTKTFGKYDVMRTRDSAVATTLCRRPGD